MRTTLRILLGLTVCASGLLAQSTTQQISGTVKDSSGRSHRDCQGDGPAREHGSVASCDRQRIWQLPGLQLCRSASTKSPPRRRGSRRPRKERQAGRQRQARGGPDARDRLDFRVGHGHVGRGASGDLQRRRRPPDHRSTGDQPAIERAQLHSTAGADSGRFDHQPVRDGPVWRLRFEHERAVGQRRRAPTRSPGTSTASTTRTTAAAATTSSTSTRTPSPNSRS